MAHSSGIQATATALDSLLAQSSPGMHHSESSTKCCCGRPQCAYLQHNDVALRGLEQDLHSAAQIGQALLVRHEAYMAEAEEQRRTMDATVDRLEGEKQALEAKNARTIQENRYLLDQLEDLNNSVSDADSQIVSLNATLQSTMKELDRLTSLAAQTSSLEKQLADLESEQQVLQEQIGSKEEGEKSAIQRWKNAERTVNALQDQVERIEKEAQDERARHAEVVARFERRRTVEKELENAAGRLKEAAAAKGMATDEDGSNSVVSSFVKDILQDNANLQLGIVELRDMLMGSNEEVENLREQMLLHQPLHPQGHRSANADAFQVPFLDHELARTPNTEAKPDFHLHQHYHAARKEETKRPMMVRRPKKKRIMTSPGLLTPSSGTQTPQTPQTPMSNPIRPTTMTSAATILAQTSVTIPPPPHLSHAHNWSMSQAPSSAAVSSVPTSPLFDAMSDVPDYSRPTTPGSTYLGSPRFPPRHFKRESDISEYNLLSNHNPSYSISSVLHSGPQDDYDSSQLQDHPPIPEELEDDTLGLHPPNQEDVETFNPTALMRPGLHRASSHESLLSARGLDIPKIRSHPSSSSTRLLSGTLPSLAGSSGVALTSATAATAHRSKAPRKTGFDSKRSYSTLLSASNNMSTSPPSTLVEKSSLGQRVGALGGWIAGRWGVGAVATTVTSPTDSVFSKTSVESSQDKGSSKPPSSVGQQAGKSSRSSGQSHDQIPATAAPPPQHTQNANGVAAPTGPGPLHLNDTLLRESLSEETVPAIMTTTSSHPPTEKGMNMNKPGHITPLHLNNSLLTETLSGDSASKAVKSVQILATACAGGGAGGGSAKVKGEVKGGGERGRKREGRLRTAVEAGVVDGEALGEALGGL